MRRMSQEKNVVYGFGLCELVKTWMFSGFRKNKKYKTRDSFTPLYS